MKRKIYLSLLACLCWAFAWSQNRQMSGRVISDSTREALAGVSVTLKGTRTSVATNDQGRYTINVPASGGTLVFSSVGYAPQEVSVGRRTTIDVTLAASASNALSDVVVIGYQSVRRRDVTGSVSSVNARQIKDVPLSSAGEALQGRLAGVQIVASDGQPGADLVVRVRGGTSISQDNSPLYIVDGVITPNALNVIAPQDIASIDVAKDAATTAIYGAAGANGVVFITLKSGRSGKSTVSYNGQVGFRHLPNTMPVFSPYDFVLYQYERSRGSSVDSASFAQTYGTTWDTLQNYKNVAPIDWQREVFGRRATFQNHNVSLTGGNQNTQFLLSLTANKEQGLQLESGFNRYLANVKVDHRISDAVRVGVNARYLDQEIMGAGTTNSGTRTTNRLRHTITYRPFALGIPNGGIDDFDEAYFLASSGATNPVLLTKAEYRNARQRSTFLTGYVSINLLKNLTFRSTVGIDYNNIRTDQFFSKITGTARNFASLPVASINQQTIQNLNNNNTLQWSVSKYRKHHNITVLAGQEIRQITGGNSFIETRYFPADITPEAALGNMGLGSVPTGSTAQQPLPSTNVAVPYRVFSLLGRVSYSYDDKYLATFNWRADRSSRFPEQFSVAAFPSGSIGWRFSQEKFMQKLSWLSDGKLRAGFGVAGNDRIGDLAFLQLYNVSGQYAFNHSIVPGFAPTGLANPNLRWESTRTINLGTDLAFLNNRIQLAVDLYEAKSTGLLLAVQIPPTVGYDRQIQNIGGTTNRGIEIQLNATPVQKKNFSWTSNFNIAWNRNRMNNLGGVNSYTVTSGWQGSDGVDDYLVEVGKPLGLMYGFVSDGFYQISDFNYNATTGAYTLKPGIAANSVYGTPQPGMMKWQDLNGDGRITPDGDRKVIGDANPDFIGGWNNQFTWKNFDASIFVNFVVGNDIYNANKIEWTSGAFANLNMLDIMKDRFTYINSAGQRVTDPTELAKMNANAKIWSPVNVQRYWLTSWAVEDGSYLRINNITLGYTLPVSLTKRAKISSFRIFATVNNLATITGYSGYDPDVTTRRSNPLTPGVDFAAYPRSRTWVAGVNVNF